MSALDGDVPMYLGLADDDAVESGSENEAGIPGALLQSTDDRLRARGGDLQEYGTEAEPSSEEAS